MSKKYFLDTEFIEGFHKPAFGKRRHYIDLISIGIVCEDGRTYSAISSEYKYGDASEWVQQNIIIPLYMSTVHGDARNGLSASNFQHHFGKSNKQIAQEVFEFCNPYPDGDKLHSPSWHRHLNKHRVLAGANRNPEFWAYYADYDWVLFCSLFGTMMDLPEFFPMYCRDLKQWLDQKCEMITSEARVKSPGCPAVDHESVKENNPFYPQQQDEHNALADARWNKELYHFISSL